MILGVLEMLSIDSTAKDLVEFGLTLNQAKAYLALLRLGTTSATQISQLCKVRREEIYRALGELEKHGLVERIIGKPLKFKPLSLERTLSQLLEKKKQDIEWTYSKLQTRGKNLLETAKLLERDDSMV